MREGISWMSCSLALAGVLGSAATFAAAPAPVPDAAAPATASAQTATFSVPRDNAIAFYPSQALHKGDVLQVRSPRLLGDETLVLAQCSDARCSDAKPVTVFKHGFKLPNGVFNPLIRTNFTIREDGRYFFQLVKNSQCYVDEWRCRNSAWPGVLHYGDPQPLRIEDAGMQGPLYRVRFSSGTWVLVRQLDVRAS